MGRLPGKDALLEKGTTDGQTKLIRVENEVLAYSWAAAESKWNLIGNVTGCVPESEEGKPKYKGKVPVFRALRYLTFVSEPNLN